MISSILTLSFLGFRHPVVPASSAADFIFWFVVSLPGIVFEWGVCLRCRVWSILRYCNNEAVKRLQRVF